MELSERLEYVCKWLKILDDATDTVRQRLATGDMTHTIYFLQKIDLVYEKARQHFLSRDHPEKPFYEHIVEHYDDILNELKSEMLSAYNRLN